MKISKTFLWMEKYILEAKRTHPKISKITRIYKIPFTCEKKQKTAGLCVEMMNGTYEIGLSNRYQDITFKKCNTVTVKPTRFSKIDILEILAHELAHMYFETHCPNHKRLECKFLMRFMNMVERDGYISEEEEFKTKEK